MAKTAVRLTELIKTDDPIVKYEGGGVEILRTMCKPVGQVTEEHARLVARMREIMHEANGIGLAAPQIGILQRIFVYNEGEEFHALINPIIVQMRGEQVGSEGCLSLPGLYGDVLRANEVTVKGLDANGKPVRIRAQGLTARVIQHENDHLDGILFIDRADPDTLHYATPSSDDEDDEDDDSEQDA